MEKVNNVIPFPGMLRTLETEIFYAIDQENFEIALEKLNVLHAHQVQDHAIQIATLICYMKLQKFEQAEQFCEQLLLDRKDRHYYEYVEYYIMILFERNKYTTLMATIEKEKEFGTVPAEYVARFDQLYSICMEVNEQQASDVAQEFIQAVKDKEHRKQWYALHQWEQFHVLPRANMLSLLKEVDMHPIVKTKMLCMLKEKDWNQPVQLTKFQRSSFYNPSETPKMDEHPIYLGTLEHIDALENENPTLYEMTKELFHQYCYVRYPYFFNEEDIYDVAHAVMEQGKLLLSLPTEYPNLNKKVAFYMEEIKVCNELYTNMML